MQKCLFIILWLFLCLNLNNLELYAQTGIFGGQWSGHATVTPLAGDASLSWGRLHPGLHWWEVESVQNAPYYWVPNRATQLSDMIAEGISPIVTIHGTPTWAKKYSTTWHCGPIDEAYMQDYKDFVTAAVNQYKGLGVKYWEIWNEPDASITTPENVYGCWGATSSLKQDKIDAGKYFGQFLAAAYDAVKAADPSAIVISGGLIMSQSSADPGGSSQVNADFFEGVLQYLQANGKQGFDIAAFHSYVNWYVSNAYLDWDAKNAACGLNSRILCRFEHLKNLLNQYGRNAPIMMNEGALNCKETYSATCDANIGLYRAGQANYLVRTTVRGMSVNMLAYSWHLLSDPGWRKGEIIAADGTLYPAYKTLKKIAPMLSGAVFQGKIGTGKNYEGHLFRKGSKRVGAM